ncbi:MAG: hypothetical protein AAFP82_22285, partial [Bacteroidota bacterium]
MKKIIFLAISFISIHCAFSQSYTTTKNASTKQQKKFKEAKSNAFNRNYTDALKINEKLLDNDPTFIDAWILKGEILYDKNELEAAKIAFRHALELDENYSLSIYYMLGAAEMNLENYEVAAKYYEVYIASKPRDQRRVERAKKYIPELLFRAKLVANPVPFNPQPLSEAINTPLPEVLPSLTADEEVFIFTRRVQEQDDFYYSQKSDGKWQMAQPIRSLNTPQNEGAQSVSADGKVIVLAAGGRKNAYGDFDLYISEMRNGRYSPPINMGDKINTLARERQPSLSSDGNTLYFESARRGGQGGSDIWVSIRQSNGAWGEAQNLGS